MTSTAMLVRRETGERRGRRVLRRLLTFVLAAGLAAAGLVALEWARLPDVKELVRRPCGSTVLLDREGRPIRYALTAREELAPRVPLSAMSEHLKSATLAAEDARFYSHPGIDGRAVLRAAWTDLRQVRIVSGASTITMQVARLLRPLSRGWYGKFREAVLAVRLEMALSKEEILELYLNLAPYGGNAIGVEAAAQRYFGRGAGDLSLGEAALVAGLPQAPARLRPDRWPERARARRDWVLDRMEIQGMISPAECAEAKAGRVAAVARPLPLVAPHFGAWALARTAPGERVRTTLDPDLQLLAEEAVRERLPALLASGVRNGAAVIVETATGKIRAMVGSQDFFSGRDGQVNGASAPRSPGSLLKPFIYGLAFEKGIAGPATVLQDRPRNFRDGYEPRNFSQKFTGSVSARDALARSLNLPAVDLLLRVGVEEAIARLRGFGLSGIRRTAGHYGLALGLGGVEVTLLELAEAYATLGREGVHRPILFREGTAREGTAGDGETAPAGHRAISAEAAWAVADILQGVGTPADERDGGMRIPRVAMKTGTSFGLRDAWAMAYSPRWTIGVWFGNFDSQPSPALVGQSAALPVALALFRRLEPSGDGPWFLRPAAAASAFPSVLELRPAPSGGVSWTLPPDGATYLRHDRAGGGELKLQAEVVKAGPEKAHLEKARPEKAQPEKAHPENAARESFLSWFIDGDFAGRSRSGESLAWPLRDGTHRVTLVTPAGRVMVRTITVLRSLTAP